MYKHTTATTIWSDRLAQSPWAIHMRPQPTSPSGSGFVAITGLERVAKAGSILEAIRHAPLVAAETAAIVAKSPSVAQSIATGLIAALADQSDAVTAIAAVHALAAIPGHEVDAALAELLVRGGGPLTAHAAWATTRRSQPGALIEPLVEVLASGGLAGMHSQAALGRWGLTDPLRVAGALHDRLAHEQSIAARSHLVETLGLVAGGFAIDDLVSIALDADEADLVRIAAVAALGDRRESPLPQSVAALARGDGRVADAAHLALSDRTVRRVDFGRDRSAPFSAASSFTAAGVSVAQVHLGAGLDPSLLRSGMGDTGGIATLLVKLGAALNRTPGITRVVTMGRATAGDLRAGDGDAAGGHQFAPVALEPEEGTSFADRWPARIAAERGIRRALRRQGLPDVLHLRMADVGTLAAANVATSWGIPIVFSLAPDPHALIASREAAGEMDRRTFGAEDASLNLWYRVSLVERLARQADHVVLFPREHLAAQLRELVGIDVKARPGRFTVVPEGIDVAEIRTAVAARAVASSSLPAATPKSGALSALLEKVSALPAHRHGLPIVLSVGRLSELKGMARLAEAMALDPALRARATLVIVGGDLDRPSAAEAAELGGIRAALEAEPELADAIVLLGHRPNQEVADLLGAVRYGVTRLIGPNGAYACASRKEEFGLAIVEALAAGLPVVAPLAGGPRTYVENGRTGWLVDTTSPHELAWGMGAALDLSDRPGRATHAAEMVAREYDISVMARALTTIYHGISAGSVEQLAS